MAFDRIISFVLRAAELAFAAIVAGLLGSYLDKSEASSWDNARHIYTIVVAALAMLLSLLWLLPFTSTFVHWPVDLFISILWFVAFGLLVDVSSPPTSCLERFVLTPSSAHRQRLRWRL